MRRPEKQRDAGVSIPALPGIDTHAGLSRTGGKPEFYLDLLPRFAGRHRDCVGEITDAMTAGDFGTAQRIAHTVKGIAGTIGADELAEAARQVETAMKSREDAQIALPALATHLDLVVDAIDGISPKSLPGVEKPAATTAAGCAEQLRRLRKLLAAGDGEASDFMAELAPSLAGVLVEEELASLSRDIGDFDFPKALTTLDEASRRLSLEVT